MTHLTRDAVCETCDHPEGKITQPLGEYDANSIWMCERCQAEQAEGIAEDLERLAAE